MLTIMQIEFYSSNAANLPSKNSTGQIFLAFVMRKLKHLLIIKRLAEMEKCGIFCWNILPYYQQCYKKYN